MPNGNEILGEVQAAGTVYDLVRRSYLRQLADYTKRNIVIYYSGWLQKPQLAREGVVDLGINELDKNGFMTAIHGMDRSKGLDLVLHTPGGIVSATESLVDYLHAMFPKDMRAIVPQLALSGGTMLACACDSIVMGKHSALGPIDPQINGRPAHAYIEEFSRAADEIKADPSRAAVWQPIIAKYPPTIVLECEKALAWAREMAEKWLQKRMFRGKRKPSPVERAKKVTDFLADHPTTRAHDRHISLQTARDLGLTIECLETDDKLQDLVLSVHHASMLTLASTDACKIIESHAGSSTILVAALR